jgi:hypothetical protein
MKFITEHKYLFIGIMIGAALVYLLAQVTTERKLSELQISLESSIENGVASTTELAKIIGEGKLTKTAEVIVTDCTAEERIVFEAKLAELDMGLPASELKLVDTLFSRCAPVQSIRRTLMVMDFVRQLEALDTLVVQRKQIGTFTKYDALLIDTRTLANHEERITQLSLDLVYLQREIIDMLITGGLVNSSKATELKERGYSLRTDLIKEAEDAAVVRARILAAS